MPRYSWEYPGGLFFNRKIKYILVYMCRNCIFFVSLNGIYFWEYPMLKSWIRHWLPLMVRLPPPQLGPRVVTGKGEGTGLMLMNC
jgi:hypothetical protein